MALPLQKLTPVPPETLGPKIVPIPVYETEMEDVAEEEVAQVLQHVRATATHPILDKVEDEVDQTLQKASRTIEDLRSVAQKDPLRFIAMVAAASFIIGVGLRLWRSSRG